MSRSSAPLALSVVNLTVPDDPAATLRNITRFDDDDFGFNHNRTWNALPAALRGDLDPAAVALSFGKVHPRVQRCITALCEFGRRNPVTTMSFKDFPDSGLRSNASIAWDPEIEVRVKASCWFVNAGEIIIPLLQPRKDAFTTEQLAVYMRLAKQAYCQGDWVDAQIKIYDLAGDTQPTVRVLDQAMIGAVSDGTLSRWVRTFVEAKKLADKHRAEKSKAKVVTPMDRILGLD